AVQISVAALTASISPVVRVPSGQYSMATRVLDGGALGIVMPHVDTAEEARAIVDHLKYPPLGHRSVAGGMAFFWFRAVPVVAAGRKQRRWTGLGGVYSEDLLAKYVAMGMRVVLAGNDLGLLMAGASQRAKFLRERQSS